MITTLMRFLVLPALILGLMTIPQGMAAGLKAELDEKGGTLKHFREGQPVSILTQNGKTDDRPYIHPAIATNSKDEVTRYSPGLHKHQTGLYWGFTRVNDARRALVHHKRQHRHLPRLR